MDRQKKVRPPPTPASPASHRSHADHHIIIIIIIIEKSVTVLYIQYSIALLLQSGVSLDRRSAFPGQVLSGSVVFADLARRRRPIRLLAAVSVCAKHRMSFELGNLRQQKEDDCLPTVP